VRRGLITKDQLEAALAGQHATGEQLGQIVVSRGYTTAAMVAQALATQHGGLLKTEYGFATGFFSGSAPTSFTEPPVSAPAASTSRRGAVMAPAAPAAADVVEAPRIVDPRADRDAVREELSLAAAETEKLQDDNARLAELRATLEQRLATESQRTASLERELADAKEEGSSGSELESRLADETRRVAELAAQLAARDATIEEFEAVAESWQTGLAERDVAIANFKAVADAWQTALAERDAAIAELRTARDDALSQLRDAKGALAAAGVDETQLSELERERDAALAKLQASEAQLAELVAARAEAIVPAATPDAEPWAAADRHLVFFQGPDGYELVERDGPPPPAGAHVQLESGVQVVARVAASPAPGRRVPCAYLIAG
jgi:hypothetical protein